MTHKLKEVDLKVTLNVPSYFSVTELKAYVKDAVEYWCKQRDPNTDDFYLGDGVKVKHLPKNSKKGLK